MCVCKNAERRGNSERKTWEDSPEFLEVDDQNSYKE